ncbi:MAG: DUF3017 domain-containing protein [Nocardioides sp.]|uniref:DUF3017 domain-containing protein n=1 Tax=Nocardioides sp. TaxID=35761 RepID=UPI0039E2E064
MTDPEDRLDQTEEIPAVSAERLVEPERGPVEVVPGEMMPGEGRRYPSTIGGAFFLVVLALAIAGVVVAATGSWRTGIRLLGSALLFAAAVRLVLRPGDAGMLAVRHKAIDAALLISVGVALILLTSSIPNQPR